MADGVRDFQVHHDDDGHDEPVTRPVARAAPARPAGPAAAPAAPPAAPPPRRSRRRLVRLTLLALGPIVVLAGAGWLYLSGGRWVGTDNAYVRAGILNVTTDVAGIVTTVPVHDNQQVAAGDVLFQLDPEPFRIRLARACLLYTSPSPRD